MRKQREKQCKHHNDLSFPCGGCKLEREQSHQRPESGDNISRWQPSPYNPRALQRDANTTEAQRPESAPNNHECKAGKTCVERPESAWRKELRDDRANIKLYTTYDIEVFIERHRQEIYQRGLAEGASEENKRCIWKLTEWMLEQPEYRVNVDINKSQAEAILGVLPTPPHKSV